MKQPLQAIVFPAEINVWEDILNGNKAVTIREGERNYEVGKPVILCSYEEAPLCVMADVQYAHYDKIKDVSPKDFRDFKKTNVGRLKKILS